MSGANVVKVKLIVAGNMKEARLWIRDYRRVNGDYDVLMCWAQSKTPFVYVKGPEELLGALPDTHEVVFCGTSYKRKDIHAIEGLCAERGL